MDEAIGPSLDARARARKYWPNSYIDLWLGLAMPLFAQRDQAGDSSLYGRRFSFRGAERRALILAFSESLVVSGALNEVLADFREQGDGGQPPAVCCPLPVISRFVGRN